MSWTEALQETEVITRDDTVSKKNPTAIHTYIYIYNGN